MDSSEIREGTKKKKMMKASERQDDEIRGGKEYVDKGGSRPRVRKGPDASFGSSRDIHSSHHVDRHMGPQELRKSFAENASAANLSFVGGDDGDNGTRAWRGGLGGAEEGMQGYTSHLSDTHRLDGL